MKFHSVRGRLKLKGYRERERERERENVFMQVSVKELFNSLVAPCCITTDTYNYQFKMSNTENLSESMCS